MPIETALGIPSIYWPFLSVFFLFLGMAVVEKIVHRQLSRVSRLLIGRKFAFYLYALILFPGVFLHEFAHWITAGFLGVRTGKFSVWPKQYPNGSIVFGYVEYYRDRKLGPTRESLIGVAPLFFGIAAILLLARFVFDFDPLIYAMNNPTQATIQTGVQLLVETPLIGMWLYLLFSIGNGMMPSDADRRAWSKPLWGLAIGVGILLVLGFIPTILHKIYPITSMLSNLLTSAFLLIIGLNLLMWIPLVLLGAVLEGVRK